MRDVTLSLSSEGCVSLEENPPGHVSRDTEEDPSMIEDESFEDTKKKKNAATSINFQIDQSTSNATHGSQSARFYFTSAIET